MESTDTLQLELPSRSLESLSFCASGSGPNIDRLELWLKEFSITDYQKNGENLANALDELTQLDCPPNELYRLTEAVRVPTLSTAHNLYHRYLKQYITFESDQQTRFDLCHRLHFGLATAYKAVVQCCLDNNEHGEMLAAALHRAISESATVYLFNSLLYHPAPERLWLELHTLYQLAIRHNHHGFQQEDPYNSKCKPMSAENLYKQVLLLSHSDTNKLSPSEIQQVWQILSVWANHCKIQPQSGLKTYFSANLNSDKGLDYAEPQPDKAKSGVIGLNVRVLTAHLDKIKKAPKISKVLSTKLIEHLMLSWGQIQKRSPAHRASSNYCETCLGLSGLHYHFSGKKDFDNIIAMHSVTEEKSSSAKQSDDVWSQAHDAEIKNEDKRCPLAGERISFNTEALLDNKRLSALQTEIINISHTGLCLKINDKLPQQFHVNELIGIRQNKESPWALYKVHCLSVSVQNEVTFGVNFIAALVDAVAISLRHKTQEASRFQRSLLLPDPKGASLIVPNFGHNDGTKFDLIHNDIVHKGQLVKCIYTTPTWCQYQFKLFE